MINVAGKSHTRKQVDAVEMLRPIHAGEYWQGIPHRVLTEYLTEAIRRRGWKIEDEKYSLSFDDADIAGAYRLTIPELPAPRGQSYSLGFMSSNARRRALKLVVGTEIFICSNGMATGEVVMQKKHSTGLDIRDEIHQAVASYADKIQNVSGIVWSLQQRELSPTETARILVETGRRGILPWSRVGQVDAEYRRPTFGDHAHPTSWGLYQAFTYIVQKQNPVQQLEGLTAFQTLLPRYSPPKQDTVISN